MPPRDEPAAAAGAAVWFPVFWPQMEVSQSAATPTGWDAPITEPEESRSCCGVEPWSSSFDELADHNLGSRSDLRSRDGIRVRMLWALLPHSYGSSEASCLFCDSREAGLPE